MTTGADLLAGAAWECGRADPAACDPADPGVREWYPATVPGTAAAAVLAADDDAALLRDYDRHTWWFRCRFTASAEDVPRLLRLDGLATIADVWLDDEHLLHSENMFVAHELPVRLAPGEHRLLVRFAPLAEALDRTPRRPRPRWRTARVHDQRLRWVRTTLLGRMPGWSHTPAPVGPWRPVTLVPAPEVEVRRTGLDATVDADGTGHVRVRAEVAHDGPARLRVGSTTVGVEITGGSLEATVSVPDVELWWPHTLGDQPLYAVELDLLGTTYPLGRVGFRTLEVDRADGAFTVRCNGVDVFCVGTSWLPPDPVGLTPSPELLRHNVELLRDGHHTMVRVPGNTVYESAEFLDLLDELGLLLWQDCMVAYVDLPADDDLEASITGELTGVLRGLQGRPCLAVVCGSADTEEQAQYHGVDAASWASRLGSSVVPALVEELVPGTAYLRSTPGGSPLPTATDTGVSHYFGVPAYLRPLADVRNSGVRFAAECLPFATPPDAVEPEDQARAERGWGLWPDPRQAVHRDSATTPWDMAETVQPYAEQLFGVDALALRQQDPERAALLTQATSVHLVEQILAEWRHPGSPCAGALTLYGHDLRLGPGLGLVDALHRPKPTWYAVRRLGRPLAVLVTDEGFSGLGVHVVNSTATAVEGRLRIDLYRDGELLLESAETEVRVPARGSSSVDTALLFGGFRDLSYAYRFGPPAADVVALSLLDGDGQVLDATVHLPGGPARRPVDDVGLDAVVSDDHRLSVSTRAFAQWVRVEVPGWRAEDSWFHLLPGNARTLALTPYAGTTHPPRGRVSALNSPTGSAVRMAAAVSGDA